MRCTALSLPWQHGGGPPGTATPAACNPLADAACACRLVRACALQEAAWRAKQEEEAKRKAEEAAAAVAAAETGDQRKAEETVAEIKREYQNWRAGGATSEAGRWRMVPAVSWGSRSATQHQPVRRLSGPCALIAAQPRMQYSPHEQPLQAAGRCCRAAAHLMGLAFDKPCCRLL